MSWVCTRDKALSTVVAKSNGRNSGAIGNASSEASVGCLMVLGNQQRPGERRE